MPISKRQLTRESKLYQLYLRFVPNSYIELERALVGCKTLLDVGCGSSSPISIFSDRMYTVGVDAFAPSIERSKADGIHNEYHQMDVMDIGKRFSPRSFDCVLAFDLIEHLSKEDGVRLLGMMEMIARERVVVFTPSGFLPQGEYESNPWQVHRSGWTPEEMRDRGYDVIGVNGWKHLRGELGAVRYRPALVWAFISDLTQLFVRSRPENAYQMLCVKNL